MPQRSKPRFTGQAVFHRTVGFCAWTEVLPSSCASSFLVVDTPMVAAVGLLETVGAFHCRGPANPPFQVAWPASCSLETQSRQGTVPSGTGNMVGQTHNGVNEGTPSFFHKKFTYLIHRCAQSGKSIQCAKSPALSNRAFWCP